MVKPTFVAVNEQTLGKVAKDALAAKRAADAESRKHRNVLEEALIQSAREKKLINDSQTLLFGYNFGRVAVAIVNEKDIQRTKAAPKNAITL